MPIRCRYENDGQGITLGEIGSAEDAARIRNYRVQGGIHSVILQPIGPKNHRVFAVEVPFPSLLRIASASDIELVV